MLFISFSVSSCVSMISRVKDDLSNSYVTAFDDSLAFDENVSMIHVGFLGN
jgi:hypothetical protein